MLYRRIAARYFNVCALIIVLNGVVVAGFGVVVLLLYVDLSVGEVALFGGCLAARVRARGCGLAAPYFLHAVAPPGRGSLGERTEKATRDAWASAAQLPLALVLRPDLYVVGVDRRHRRRPGPAALLGLPAYQAAQLLPMSYLLYVSSSVLRYVGLELSMRPVLRDVGQSLPRHRFPDSSRVSLHQRLLVTVPMVTWGTALIVGGLLTPNTR